MTPDHSDPSAARRDWLASILLQRQTRLMPRLLHAYAGLAGLGRNVRRRLGRRAALTVAGAALALTLAGGPLLVPPVRAANITVGGTCSLVDAIRSANSDTSIGTCTAGSGADTITLTGNVTLTAASGNYYSSATGLPLITSTITINGAGSTIARDGAAPTFRLLAMDDSAQLTLQNVTLSVGHSSGDGGAVYSHEGVLTIINSTISDNYAAGDGGGVFNDQGGLTITDSTISGNDSDNEGGGVYSDGASATTIVTGSTIRDNYAEDNGGAIYNNFGALTVNDSTISDNDADENGGGIFNYQGALTITGSTISGNYADDGGGGVYSDGSSATTTVTRSTIRNNIGDGDGGGLYNDGGTMTIIDSLIAGNTTTFSGGGLLNFGQLTITGSTISGNATVFDGGGIYNDGGLLLLTNSTVSGNQAGFEGGGIYTESGATTTVTNSTITGNTAGFNGGGVYGRNNSVTNLIRSLVSGNSAATGAEVVRAAYGAILAANHNVFGHSGLDNAAAFSNFTPSGSDVTATSNGNTPTALAAILNTTLADNGGPTETHNLVAGSPAIDLAPSGDCALPPVDGVDQRGAVRPFDGNGGASATECDAGAVEFGAPLAGTIVIVKEATPADDTAFDFTENIPRPGNGFTLSDPSDDTETINNVPPGSYVVTEAAEAGWGLDNVTCVDPTNDSSGNVANRQAVIALAPGETVTCTFSNGELTNVYVSATTAGTTGNGVSFGPHDILRWDGNAWSKWFNGSAAGLMPNGQAVHNINATWIADPAEDDVVLAFAQDARVVPGIPGKVNGMDLVWWNGSSFLLWFDGEDVGLTNQTQEKIDALHVLPGNLSPIGGSCQYYLLISTAGDGQVPNHSGGTLRFDGTDVLGFCLTNSGANTAGFWHRVLNGKAESMPGQALVNLSASDDGQVLYLTTKSAFNVDDAHGGHSVVYRYDFATGEFSGPHFSAPANGLPRALDALHVDGELP